MKPILKIYVTAHCFGCSDARRIATEVAQTYPHLGVEIVDLEASDAEVPDAVFATPTYMLNNRIVSLGTPSPEEVAQWAAEPRINSS